MDNLYTIIKFAKACLNHPKKVLIHGVITEGIHGFPNCVNQEEQKTINRQEEQSDKKKAAILVGNSTFPNMICTSVYNTKPVHFVSMSCENIGWVVKERKVWSKS